MIWFGAINNLGGAFVTANLYSEIATLVSEINQDSNRFERKLTQTENAMQAWKLPLPL
jgi:hypothetical protein